MSSTGELFLGIIAFAVVVMAAIQVAAIFAGIRLARRVDELATQMDQEIKPLLANLSALSSEAARAAALAAKQAERFDKVFGEVVEGMAIVNGITRRDPNQNPDFPGDAIETITITEE